MRREKERVERIEPGEETGEEQGKGRRRRKVNRKDSENGCGFEQERKGGRKCRHERECGESKHERERSTEVRSVRCAADLDLKLYFPHFCFLSPSLSDFISTLSPGRL